MSRILFFTLLAGIAAAEPVDMAKRAEELKNLRWGMFICWSFSTFSGTEWTPGVTDVAFFKATDVDTDQWVRTAKEAGMGYILFLTKHHDGFCLWDTKTTDRKVTNSPLKRDVLSQLKKSCDKYGIKLALYFSEGEWRQPGGLDDPKTPGPKKRNQGGQNAELKKVQLKELLTQYGPIEYIWFDHAVGEGGLSHKETLAWCKQFQPGCFVGFNHGDQEGADIRLGEMGKPGPLADHQAAGPHMRDAPSKNYLLAEFTYPILPEHKGGANWFYSLPEHDNLCHPAEKLYGDYLGAVKNGNIFSIDVGPDHNGKLRAIDVATLRKVGEMIRNKAPEPVGAAGDDLGWVRGANYVPSYAKNDVQTWMEYDPAVVDRELGYAARLKLNTVRVFLNVAVYEKQPEKFQADFESFLSLCDKHQIKMMPVLFDSCFDPQEVDVNNYRGKNWIPSPGFGRLGNEDWPAMEKFISAVVGKYHADRRIVLWDVMNEPESTGKWRLPEGKTRILDFVRRALKRVKDEKPVQPLGIGWASSGNISFTADLSDVLIVHNYGDPITLDDNIRRIKEMGKSMNKPVILNEFAGRPRQPIEKALPVVAREKMGWCFWELMIGSTQFSQDRMPYQGHLYPDGKCFSVTEVAAILNPEGVGDDAEAIAQRAGFVVSEKVPKAFTEEAISFSPFWNRWEGRGPADGRLWYANTAGQTVSKEVTGTSIELVLKHGPDCGIAGVTIDGKPAAIPEIDTYAKDVDWNGKTLVAKNLPAGKHTVVVTVTGRKAAAASNGYLQIVKITGSEAAERLQTPPMHFGDATRLGRPFAKDPSVIRFGGRYLLYYSVTAWAKELAPPDAPRGWAIGIAESHDLVNWKKVGVILPEQECEKNGLVNGRIILLDGKLHLFYNTYGNGPKDALCHAWSADGIHFTRNPTNPIWRPRGAWNNGRAIDVDVVEWGDDLIMYYATRDPAGKIQMLHAIAAPRKSGFNRGDWKSLRDGPVLSPELPWEKSCIEAPSVIKRGDTLYLFYGGGYNNDPQQIGCAVSKDGIHFQRLFTDKPLLPNGAPGQWNSSESGHPGMFEDDEGQLYMFYQGNNDRGRTWFLSWVKIGWDGDKPRVIEPHVD